MASTGATAWAKYFQGKGDIETTLKKDSPVYDVDEPNSKIGDLKAGTKITYLKAPRYDSKAIIKYKERTALIIGRVSFNNIAKPGVRASGAASLKPQAFGVKETEYSLTDYIRIVNDHIEDRTDLSPPLRTYLSVLFNYYAGKCTELEVKGVYSKVKNDIPINDINKDFGEVVGPVGVYKKQLLTGNTLSPNMKVFMPLRPNEPLMDYAIIDGNRKYVISAKSGKTTNVVKPGDILMLLQKDPAKVRLWKDTKEYKILETLANSSIINGPVNAVSKSNPELISEAAAASLTRQDFDTEKFANFINQNEYLKNKKNITSNEIMYECEKLIQAKTKSGDLNMNSIFAAAIDESVIYIKFEIDFTGIGKWVTTISSDITSPSYGNVFLRTKNGYTRASDRMGIQV